MNVKHIDEIPSTPVTMEGAEGVTVRRLITDGDGAENFVMRMFEVSPGGWTPLHTHSWEHEIYVLEGQGVIVFEGREFPLRPGNVLFVPGGRDHQFKCTHPTRFRFLCIVPPEGEG